MPIVVDLDGIEKSKSHRKMWTFLKHFVSCRLVAMDETLAVSFEYISLKRSNNLYCVHHTTIKVGYYLKRYVTSMQNFGNISTIATAHILKTILDF